MGFFSKIICFFSGIKNLQDEFNKDPAGMAQHVIDKGYKTPAEQRDFCERLEIDYYQLQREIDKLNSINQWSKNLTIVWTGEPHQLTFDYQDSEGGTSNRTVSVEEVLINDSHQFYIKGQCSNRQEQRHFNIERITNLTINGINTNFYDWCNTTLNIDLFNLLPPKTKSNIKKVIWQGECPPTTFSYRDIDRERVTVSPIRLESTGSYKNLIALKSNGLERTFFVQNIDTMLATEGHKKKHFDDWVNDVLLAKQETGEVPEDV
jgi:hypothetical protein